MRLPLSGEAAGLWRAGRVLAKSDSFAPATLRQNTLQGRCFGIDHHTPLRRHSAHQVMELPLNGRQVVKNISVVKLQVVQDRCAGTVMHKLAAFVKKSGVVLIGLNHEVAGPPEPRGHTKVQRHAAN